MACLRTPSRCKLARSSATSCLRTHGRACTRPCAASRRAALRRNGLRPARRSVRCGSRRRAAAGLHGQRRPELHCGRGPRPAQTHRLRHIADRVEAGQACRRDAADILTGSARRPACASAHRVQNIVKSNAPTRSTSDPADVAIARVLQAERDARESIEHARREAESIAESARAAARAVAERTEGRIRGVVDVFAQDLDPSPGRDRRRSRAHGHAAFPGRRRVARAGRRRADAGARTGRARAMIECGSIEYAQARLQSRHGRRATEAQWQQLESTRRVRRLARRRTCRTAAHAGWQASPRRPPAADRGRTAHPLACGGGRNRGLDGWAVARRAGLVRRAARPAGAAAPGARRHARRLDGAGPALARAVRSTAGRAHGRAGPGPWRVLARAWSAPDTLAGAWLDEWRRRLPQPLHDADDSLRQVAAVLRRHAAAFAAATPGSGTPLRRALQARLSLLMRRATLEPAVAFTHLALSALELERLRGELLVRKLFPNAKVA